MSRQPVSQVLGWGSLAVFLMAMLLWVGPARAADEPAAKAAKPAAADKEKAKKASSRLPMYFAQVVDKGQRAKIVAILADYNVKIDALTKERDEKVNAVLTPEQLKKVQELKAAAKDKRNAGKAAETAKEPETAAPDAAKGKGKKKSK